MQVCEDYEEDEREKFSEELAAIKKRFSQTKDKRKWVSKVVFRQLFSLDSKCLFWELKLSLK